MNVVIIDYKSGNTKSVSNLLNLLKVKNSISCKKKDIIDCTHLILPGVGAYEAAMRNLKENLEIDFLNDIVLEKKKTNSRHLCGYANYDLNWTRIWRT